MCSRYLALTQLKVICSKCSIYHKIIERKDDQRVIESWPLIFKAVRDHHEVSLMQLLLLHWKTKILRYPFVDS